MTRRTLEERIASAARDLGQLEARRLFKDLTRGARAKAKARRLELRRRFELGGAVIAAGCGDWTIAEVAGLIANGREQAGASPTMRMGFRQQGESMLASQSLAKRPRLKASDAET